MTDRVEVFTLGVLHDQFSYTENTEDGPIQCWGDIFHVGASTPSGRNFVLLDRPGADTIQAFSSEAEAEAELRGITHNPAEVPAAWSEVSPSYGSDAWGSEDEYELACFEADCFNEPRPRWGF